MIIHRKQKGFTLFETIVVISIFATMSIAISLLIVNFYKTYRHVIVQAQTVIMAERSITSMVREIREATTAQDGAYILATTTDNEFSFYSDVDRDDVVELIKYYFVDGKLMRTETNPTSTFPPTYNGITTQRVVASNIINGPSIFKYYDKGGSELFTTPVRRKDTEMMRVTVIINTAPNIIGNYELHSNVQLRNLKSNI